jgi:protein gp37
MGDRSRIEWTDATWNPVTGCTHVSPACDNCYAERMSKRLAGRAGYPADEPFKVTVHEDRFDHPIRWTRPRMIFVCSMGDLFHVDVGFPAAVKIFARIAQATHHTFLVLTKRPKRMQAVLSSAEFRLSVNSDLWRRGFKVIPGGMTCVLPNLWVGTTVENRATLPRLDALRKTPAARRFVSFEPLLGDIGDVNLSGIGWVIAGGESGPKARPSHPDWFRSLRDQCVAADVPFLFKQWGEYAPPSQIPDHTETYRCWAGQDDGADPETPWRFGKKAAGRELDGRTWDEEPPT